MTIYPVSDISGNEFVKKKKKFENVLKNSIPRSEDGLFSIDTHFSQFL